jgi:DNA-binding response OmpR family regulator
MPLHKVLIVDDEPALRRVLRLTLTAMGFEAQEATDGEQALIFLADGRYDTALLDINMPGKDGIATCRELRHMLPDIQILMMSVRDQEEDRKSAFDAGADDYFVKPFSVPKLVTRLRAAAK